MDIFSASVPGMPSGFYNHERFAGTVELRASFPYAFLLSISILKTSVLYDNLLCRPTIVASPN